MGVCGTGKSTVGGLLADELGVPYAEADAFHPPANIAKMTGGTPLDDTDREPWLDAIGAWARGRTGLGGVVSCSALKRSYRDRLRAAAPGLFFLHLTGDRALIAERMERRRDHFMPGALLDSQFAALEPLQVGEFGAAVSVDRGPGSITAEAVAVLRNHPVPAVPEGRPEPAAPGSRPESAIPGGQPAPAAHGGQSAPATTHR
ncbi:gluconokinase [Streptomyces pathocidini]|uniref:gluconokinase n=1 Tax=Streptomyces pathocidini TaxID=1650571 RepID=UPI003F4CB75C